MENRKINILGTEWKIVTCKEEESELLNGKCRDGCTDNSTRTIWICEKKDDCELQDYEMWKKLALRHEILHAFLFESGLDASSIYTYGPWANNEEMVDWFAIQSPKIFKVYSELGLLEGCSASKTTMTAEATTIITACGNVSEVMEVLNGCTFEGKKSE